MRLIIVLIALALERYLNTGNVLHRFNWLPCYLSGLRSFVKPDVLWRGWLGVLLVLLPLLIGVTLLGCLLYWWLSSFGLLLFGVLALIYCLGPDNLYQQLKHYFSIADSGDETARTAYMQELLSATPAENEPAANHTFTVFIFTQAQQRVFGVLFWFAVLGPLGAILYRLTTLIQALSNAEDSAYSALNKQITCLQNLLEWLPARLTSLIITLVGNFNKGIKIWLEKVWHGLGSNRQLIVESGLAALESNADKIEMTEIDEHHAASGIIDRVLIIMLVIIAVFILGAWFN